MYHELRTLNHEDSNPSPSLYRWEGDAEHHVQGDKFSGIPELEPLRANIPFYNVFHLDFKLLFLWSLILKCKCDSWARPFKWYSEQMGLIKDHWEIKIFYNPEYCNTSKSYSQDISSSLLVNFTSKVTGFFLKFLQEWWKGANTLEVIKGLLKWKISFKESLEANQFISSNGTYNQSTQEKNEITLQSCLPDWIFNSELCVFFAFHIWLIWHMLNSQLQKSLTIFELSTKIAKYYCPELTGIGLSCGGISSIGQY